jgi:hypothetical protein
MAFEILETVSKINIPPQATLSYLRAVHKNKKPKADAKPQLRITIPTTICGISKSERFHLMIGSGDHLGRLRVVGILSGLAQGKDEGTKPTQLRATFRFNFGWVPRLGDDIFDGQRFPIQRINDEIFEITMPPGFIPVVPAAQPASKKK